MENDGWRTVLVVMLAFNAALGFGYRLFRLARGGPMSDVIGQAVLGLVLSALAVAASAGLSLGRWGSLAYGLLFGILVMPIWVLAVLIPLRPRWPDYAFTGAYWAALFVIVVAALGA